MPLKAAFPVVTELTDAVLELGHTNNSDSLSINILPSPAVFGCGWMPAVGLQQETKRESKCSVKTRVLWPHCCPRCAELILSHVVGVWPIRRV